MHNLVFVPEFNLQGAMLVGIILASGRQQKGIMLSVSDFDEFCVMKEKQYLGELAQAGYFSPWFLHLLGINLFSVFTFSKQLLHLHKCLGHAISQFGEYTA